jgi:hypothetical protein
MHILTLELRVSELNPLSIKTYLRMKYPHKILVRVFISSLYFDTFFVEALFL